MRIDFVKIYGKSLRELAAFHGVSIPIISKNHRQGLPLGTRKNRGGNRERNTRKLMDKLTVEKEVKNGINIKL